MSTELPQTSPTVTPITSLDDPRVIQILSTEHWSLLGARSLAYNEAFVRGGMFLTFLSMSFVALALLAQGMSFGTQFLTIAAVVLAFDLVIGLATYGRINGANIDDLRAVHGMARIATPTPRSHRSPSRTSRLPRTMTSTPCSSPTAARPTVGSTSSSTV